jgi:CRP-like cAMP-binding protein
MLGVQRPTITHAVAELEEAGLIARGRREITILDRQGLTAASCECYQLVRERVASHLPRSELRKAMNASRTLHSLLLKFVQVFMVQTAHTAIANARANIDKRPARWILMGFDRTSDETLPLTHEFLSLMLGVRRAGITEALQSFKRQKLIDTSRNQIVVHNRKGLERLARGSYGVSEKEYRRLIG